MAEHTLTATDSVTPAALARFNDYLRRAPTADEEQRLIASDAYIQGFFAGARWSMRATASLSSPDFRQAINVLAQLWENEP